MIDVEKLKSTIDDLENEVENIKKISKIVSEIERISKEVKANKEEYNQIANDLMGINNKISGAIEINHKLLNEVRQEVGNFQKVNAEKLDEISKHTRNFSSELMNILTNNYKTLEEKLNSKLNKLSEEIKENHINLVDVLEEDVARRIDKSIEKTNQEIKNIAKNLEKTIHEENQKLLDELKKIIWQNEEIKRSLKLQKIFLIFPLFLTTILFIIAYLIKMF